MRYRVAWKSRATGYEGHGKWFPDKKLVLEMIKEGNKDGDISHWLKEETTLCHQTAPTLS